MQAKQHLNYTKRKKKQRYIVYLDINIHIILIFSFIPKSISYNIVALWRKDSDGGGEDSVKRKK